MGDASEENYLPGPLLDTREVKRNVLKNPPTIQRYANYCSETCSLILLICVRFPSAWSVKQSVTTAENQISVDTEGEFSLDFPLVSLRSSEPVICSRQ